MIEIDRCERPECMTAVPLEVQLPSGETIWARVAVEGPANVSSGVLQRLDVEDLRRTVRGVSSSLREAVDDLTPDQLEVEFGLELSLRAGKLISMLAEAGATATVKVTLGWTGSASARAAVAGGGGVPTAVEA
jgi:hypothetical protein